MTKPSQPQQPKLLTRMRREMRVRHMSYATEKTYVQWVRRFILFHGRRHPRELAEPEVNAFLSDLANERKVSASTQTQALCAIVFFYRHVVGREISELQGLVRAKRPRRLPVVLTPDEVRSVLSHTDGVARLVLTLLYGSGLRLAEGLRLRVKDLDFTRLEITVREGKGAKDRRTMLPSTLVTPLERQLARAKELQKKDLREGFGRVALPHALARKYRNADTEWGWQFVFPSHKRSQDPHDNEIRRHHLYPQTVRRAMKRGLRQARIVKHATIHSLRVA